MTDLIENDNLSENLIIQSNDLISAVYDMTLREKQVLLACISQVDSRKTITEGKEFVLTVEQAQGLFYTETNKMHAYNDLKTVSERLLNRVATIKLNESETLKTHFVQSIKFNDETSSVSLLFAEKIKPYISELEDKFTKYRLEQVKQMRNKNAVRLFELSVMWLGQANTPYIVKMFELDDLRDVLGHLGKYKQFGQFKKMLGDSVTQLNKSTEINIKIAYKKTRARFTHVQLKIERRLPQAKIEDKESGGKAPKADNPTRDPNTLDWVNNLTDMEKQIITEQAELYINKKGITDEKHRKNIINKAFEERWGLDDYKNEQAENEKYKKRLEEEKQRELEQKRAEEEKRKQAQKELDECEDKFLKLPQAMQNIVLETLENRLPMPFKKNFKEDLQANNKVYRNVEYAGTFKQIMKDF